MIAALVDRTDVIPGGVPAIKDEGDLGSVLGELMVTVDQGFGDALEEGNIVLVPGVAMGEEGHVEIGADQKG